MIGLKKGDIFEFYCHEGDYEHVCLVDFDGASEEEIRLMLAELYEVEPRDIRIATQTLCTTPRGEIQDLSDLWRAWNFRRKKNEYEGLPSSVYIREFKPEEIYRVMLDKKNNELQLVLKNGASLTVSVAADKAEKQLIV